MTAFYSISPSSWSIIIGLVPLIMSFCCFSYSYSNWIESKICLSDSVFSWIMAKVFLNYLVYRLNFVYCLSIFYVSSKIYCFIFSISLSLSTSLFFVKLNLLRDAWWCPNGFRLQCFFMRKHFIVIGFGPRCPPRPVISAWRCRLIIRMNKYLSVQWFDLLSWVWLKAIRWPKSRTYLLFRSFIFQILS